MNIKEIPKVLFQEFSEKFGQGEERRVVTYGHDYLLKELNSEKAGFSGAIGWRENSSHFGFALWVGVPRGKDDVLEPRPVLTITAGPESTGEWASGRGYKVRETGLIKFPHGVNLKNLALGLIPLILRSASVLAVTAQFEEFWEGEGAI